MENKKILVVDDSDIERMYLLELIKQIDLVTADEAKGFDEAVKKLEEQKYDLLIIDYYLAEGTGDALLKLVVSGNPCGNADTKAIVLGNDNDFGGDFLRQSGFFNFIEKPVEFNMLRAAINMYA